MKSLELKFVLDAVDRLTTPLKSVQKQLDSLQKKVKNTTTELNKLQQQEKTANSFKRLENALQQNNQKLVEAREKAKKLAEQLKNTAAPTAALKRQVESAHKSAHRLAQAQEHQRKKLNELRQSLRQGGFDTSKFKESQEKLKQKIKQSTAAIEKQNAAMAKLHQRQAKYKSYRESVDNLKNKSDQLRTFGQRSMIAGTVTNALSGVMLKPALDFEQDFSRVQALTGLSKANPEQAAALERLRNQGTSGEVAQGQGYLAMAGFNADQIEKSMPAILSMTKAAGIEMGQVSDISSDISSGFKISADEMGRVADVLTATFSGSNTTLEGLGDTMKYLGPIATATGQDFETMSAMVGLLGNVGIKGTQAGTSLRSAMLRLAAPPKQAAKALKSLGVSAKDSRGNMRALTNILIDVERKTAKMGTGDRMAYYKAIFGTEAATAMVELVKQAGVNGIQEFTDKLKNSAGRAEQVAQTMADNLLGDIKNLESAREAVGIAIYDTISDDMRASIQLITEMVRKVNEWIKANPELTAKIVKWGAAMAGAVTALGALSLLTSFVFYPIARIVLGLSKLDVILPKFMGKVIDVGGAISRWLLSPLKLLPYVLSLGGAAFIGAGLLIYKFWQPIKAFFGGFWEGLKSGLAPVLEKFQPLGTAFSVVVGWIEKAVKWFTDLLSPVQSTKEDLDAAASAGKQFGEWIAAGIDLALKPLQLLMDGIKWVIDNMPGIQSGAKIVENSKQLRNEETNKVIKSGSITERTLDALSDSNMYSSGGYTGNGGKYEPMGIVHGGEYVMTKEATSRLGINTLNALNYGKQALIAGGLGISVATAAPVQVDTRAPISARPMMTQTSQPMSVNITINAAQGMDERAIAQQVAKEIQRIENQRQARARSSMWDRA